jgi:hypothetical protein
LAALAKNRAGFQHSGRHGSQKMGPLLVMFIRLNEPQTRQLRQIANHERRELREQAAVLILEGLGRRAEVGAQHRANPSNPAGAIVEGLPVAPALPHQLTEVI